MNTNYCSPRTMRRGFQFGNWPMYFDDMLKVKNGSVNVPSVNIIESENEWQIEVSAPGFTKEEFKVNFEENLLTISAERKADETKPGKNYTRREFSCESFTRSFRVKQATVDAEKISAVYENGILIVSIPKVAEEKKGITINIQ